MQRTVAQLAIRAGLYAVGLFSVAAVYAQPCAVGGDHRASATSHCRQSTSPASHPNADPTTGTGLSIDLISGNKFLQQTDAVWPGGLVLARYYNSLNRFRQSLGFGWRHSFDTVLALSPSREPLRGRRHGLHSTKRKDYAQIVQADGRRIVFTRVASPAPVGAMGRAVVYGAINPVYGAIRLQPQVGADRRWRWRWRDGSSLYFSVQGRLTAVHRANGDLLTMHYDSYRTTMPAQSTVSGSPVRPVMRLSRVSNRYGQSLRFFYDGSSQRLSRVQMPDRSVWLYQYSPLGELAAVRYQPPGNNHKKAARLQWRFDYADHFVAALTRVMDQRGRVRQLVRYNQQGRAVFSAPSDRPRDPLAVSVHYRLPSRAGQVGVSTLTDSGQQQTTYRWRYNARSQRRELLSAAGPTCSVCPPSNFVRRYDPVGRPRSLHTKDGRLLRRWQYDEVGRLRQITRITATGQRRWRRFAYAGRQFDAPLVLIERNSVAPGKSYRLALHYNSLGQIERVVETGFAPALARMVGQTTGKSIGSWRVRRWYRLRREVRLRYITRGPAQGLLAQIDGPLSGANDTTRFHYDTAGRLVRAAGGAGQFVRFDYDNLGRLRARSNSAGLRWQFRYGHGWQQTAHRGVTVTRHVDLHGPSNRMRIERSDQPTRIVEWDAMGSLVRLANTGNQWLTRNALGLNAQSVIRLEARRGYQPPSAVRTRQTGATRVRWRLAQSGDRDASETELRIIDDFGRTVALADSIAGVLRVIYDNADRIIATAHAGWVDQAGRPAIRLYRYDAQGRLIGINSAQGQVLRNHYAGGFVRRQDQLMQTVIHERAVATKSHFWQVKYHDPVSGVAFKNSLRFGEMFDSHGRLSRRQLPGGWQVAFEWSPDNRKTAIALLTPGGTRVNLASALRWMPFTAGRRGLLSARYGNGTGQRVVLDNRLRVTRLQNGSGMPTQQLRYDATGRVVSQTIGSETTHYRYNRRNHLVSWTTGNDGKRQNAGLHRQPLATKSRAGKQARSRWMTDASGRVSWTYDGHGRAYRYVYNLQRERIGKIAIGKPQRSRWFIYHQNRLLMEADADGNPLVAYLYLDGRPFVMLRYQAGGSRVVPFWIHTDHRGLPLAVSDTNRRIVWRQRYSPYGAVLNPVAATTTGQGRSGSTRISAPKPSFMPLRLPGQYFDADTGLHDNYQRTYNPQSGRYLGPDPLGMRAGSDRYDYANLSPMDTADPFGLYEIDVHYYMTYFLARMAGIGHTDADVIAHAAQGIDDNPLTRPVDPGPLFGQSPLTPFVNQRRLLAYHFVLYDPVRAPLSLGPAGHWSPNTADPHSLQLSLLRLSVRTAMDGCARMQLLGEMLHAYQDTYSHRNEFNVPMDAISFYGLGVGHLFYGHLVDYTYNHALLLNVNEQRTLQMERDVYNRLLQFGNRGASIPFEQFESVLREFNRTRENNQTGFEQKLAILDAFLRESGVVVVNETGVDTAQFSVRGAGAQTVVYDGSQASRNRERYLCGQEYVGVGVIRPRC